MARETVSPTDADLRAFAQGEHTGLYRILGAHPQAAQGTRFAVWAPNAERVCVVGDFNAWHEGETPLRPRGDSGVFEGVHPAAGVGDRYKFAIRPRRAPGEVLLKADPFALRSEVAPATASIVADLAYRWGDGAWMASRAARSALDAPMAIYEVHLGSFLRGGDGALPSYADIGARLVEHARSAGFTHVEILPLMEHPFYGSWGYETTGYFAPTGRFGAPADLMALVDTLHRAGIGVVFDWVPSHFPADAHGLARFDGTALFEHADPRQGWQPDWDTLVFNYGRHEVRSFLLSSAHLWCDLYHADGLRVDAVASMLYLDYSRAPDAWVPNVHGGRENLDAIAFLRRLNETLFAAFPGIQTFAEESTAWPMVSRPTYLGGLGFGYKWDMGFMHDTLAYFAKDPVHRQHHQDMLTFRNVYADAENFVLPFSHDEVVHGKGSLLGKMPGDAWQRFANLRLLLAYTYGQPGKKLLFMGDEFGQEREWSHDRSLDWHLLDLPPHRGVLDLVRDLNRLYRTEPALHQGDCRGGAMAYIDAQDRAQNVLAFVRTQPGAPTVLIVCHFAPTLLTGYRLGVPHGGRWREVLNTDAAAYGGSGQGNLGEVQAQDVPSHGRPASLCLTLGPLAAHWFVAEAEAQA